MNAYEELRELVSLTGIPVAQTLMGLGVYPLQDDLSLKMLGMHGTVYANYSVHHSDLLLAVGVRFDDRVTGKLESFAAHATIVHIDVDPAEIHKNKHAHIPVCADSKPTLQMLNSMIKDQPIDAQQFQSWRGELKEQKKQYPLTFPQVEGAILPQMAIRVDCQ